MNTRFHSLEFALHACSMLWVLMDLQTSSLHCLGGHWTNYANMCMQPSTPGGLWHSHSISYFRAGCRSTREQRRKDVSMRLIFVCPSPPHLLRASPRILMPSYSRNWGPEWKTLFFQSEQPLEQPNKFQSNDSSSGYPFKVYLVFFLKKIQPLNSWWVMLIEVQSEKNVVFSE